MADNPANSRTSRTRQAIAILAWLCLIGTAFFLWNARQTGLMTRSTDPGSASFLAAFSAFVSVFAWMLFNPNQTRSAQSPQLFLAAAATLFPSPIIAFNLISSGSPLRWWVAFGIFLLLVIAILSHVPDEFFGVPRGRSTYVMPLPVFDRVENSVMDPNASWFRFNDLCEVVEDCERPSLAPRAYRNQETTRPVSSTAAVATYAPTRPVSEVDDILGSDFDLGLLDDPMMEMDLQSTTLDAYTPERTETRQSPRSRQAQPSQKQAAQIQTAASVSSTTHYPQQDLGNSYERRSLSERRTAMRLPSALNRPGKRERFFKSIRTAEPNETVAPTTFRDSPTTDVTSYSARTRRRERSSEADPLDFTPLQQREQRESKSQSDSHQSDYLQQTKRSRAQRHRADARTGSTRSESGETNKARSQTSQLRTESEATDRITETPPDQQKSSRRSLFGIPVPFGRSTTTDPEVESTVAPAPVAETNQLRRNVSTTSESESASRRTASTAHQNVNRRETSATPSPPPRDTTGRADDFERTEDAHGGQLVEGVMTVRFDKGQKRANLHIPFSPPLKGMPEVECECVEDVPVRLKVPVRQSYGIRIEARRSDASEPLEADVGFAAMYSPE